MGARDGYELRSARFQNVRAFDNTVLRLDGKNIVLVGPNNAGKTSLLRMLEWLFNGADEALLREERALTSEEHELLLPARRTRGRARRITLSVYVPDGRHARRFDAEDHLVSLRIGIQSNSVWVQVGPPKRGELMKSSELGLEFLRNLQQQYRVRYISSTRDAVSGEFTRLVI